jgi:hypothetical protein
MSQQLNEQDLLGNFEQRELRSPYKDYYMVRRNNLFASIEAFRDLWDCFMLANEIWMREFADMHSVSSTGQMFPLALYMNAHAKMLVAMELAFSGCVSEAHSILRDAIESLAHAHRVLSDVALQRIWVERNDGEAGRKAFDREFWHSKREKLFVGLPDLYDLWKQFSDWGSHTNMESIMLRFNIHEDASHIEWRMNYTGIDPDTLEKVLCGILNVFGRMQQIFYEDFRGRLQLDHELMALCTRFHRNKESVRVAIIRKHNIQPPNRKSRP